MKIGCVIMASGRGKRFGSNKLLAQFQGKMMYQRALELTSGNLFDKRIVITRTSEVYEGALVQGIDAIYHELPNRNDVVRLGIEQMKDMDACVFCPCDQPLLTTESLEHLIEQYRRKNGKVFRLAWEETPGTPILFDKSCFQELSELPEKKGGSYLAAKYKDEVQLVQVKDKRELKDIDTKEDLEELEAM